MTGLRLITAPAEEPVTLADAKARLRVTVDDEDSDIASLISEARAAAENECQRAFVSQAWSLFLDTFPCGADIRLPLPPLQSVTWIKYYDAAGDLQTLSTEDYWVAVGGDPGRVTLPYNAIWPITQYGRPEAVEIRFVAGYGEAASVPPEAVAAVKMILSDRWANPGGGSGAIPDAARRLLNGLEYGEIR